MPAIAGHSCNRIHKTEDFLDILDWEYLAIMLFLHFALDKPSHQCLYELGGIGKLFQVLDAFGSGIAFCEILNHFASADVA